MRPISCPATSNPAPGHGATSRAICRTLRQPSRACAVKPLKPSAPPPRATPSHYSPLQIRKQVRARPQLRGQAVPRFLILFGWRECLVAALDDGKFHFDTIEHHHPLWNSLGEFSDVGKQQSSFDRHVADNGFDGRDAIVEGGLRIIEGITMPATHDGPITHLIAAE